MRRIVVLPHPLGPTNVQNSPSLIIQAAYCRMRAAGVGLIDVF